MSTAIKLLVGLGNPGPQYETTRHNAGAWFIETLARQQNLTLRAESKFLGLYQKARFANTDCHILLPTTFMNHSGAAVAAVARFYKIATAEILVIHDELDLAPGTARLKLNGGHAGHNGLRDILSALGSTDFYRLRLGIGRPTQADKTVDYVLSTPGKTERQLIDTAIDDGLHILPDLLKGDFAQAMQTLHTRES